MKSKSSLWLYATTFFCLTGICLYVFAQRTEPRNYGRTYGEALTAAIMRLENDENAEAKELIDTIDENDPDYDAAQAYGAVCAFRLDDLKGFLNAMETLDLNQGGTPPEIREDLAYKQIDALFNYRKFESLLERIPQFQSNHPNSSELWPMFEYQMATLFERGMKKTLEASTMWNDSGDNPRWTEGEANLQEFLLLAASHQSTNYTTLTKRNLREDTLRARIVLGQQEAVFNEIPTGDVATQEEVSLLTIEIYRKLQPENMDRNLDMLQDFIRDFPESRRRKRIEFDIATVSFERGKQLCMEADEAGRQLNGKASAEKRAAAQSYFQLQRSLKGHRVNPELGINTSDVFDMRKDLIHSYWYERDYAGLRSVTTSRIADSTPGGLDWIVAKLFLGIAIMSETPGHSADATPIFDEILACGFTGKPDQDHLVECAVRWRLHIARTSDDTDTVQQLVSMVRDGICTKNIKEGFFKYLDQQDAKLN